MKIAIIAPPWRKLPSHDYTGIETVISDLSEKLVETEHKVILFAPDGSTSLSEVIHYPPDTSEINWKKADKNSRYYLKNIIAKYACTQAMNLGVDIIHNFTLAGEFENPVPSLHTVYGPPDEGTVKICKDIAQFAGNYFAAISNRQRVLFNDISSDITFVDTVYKSINTDEIQWDKNKEDYFLFIGHKDQEQSLELARRVSNTAGKRLVAVIQGTKKQLFNEEIKPWLDHKTLNFNLQFTEDLPQEARYDLYRKAKGTFYINQWEEPFGMEMLESLACGTPVIALSKGASPEVIENGKTGFLVETESEMVEAVKNINSIDPAQCRHAAEENFSAKKITEKYLEIYNSIL